jgi:hypothetical protein
VIGCRDHRLRRIAYGRYIFVTFRFLDVKCAFRDIADVTGYDLPKSKVKRARLNISAHTQSSTSRFEQRARARVWRELIDSHGVRSMSFSSILRDIIVYGSPTSYG